MISLARARFITEGYVYKRTEKRESKTLNPKSKVNTL